MALGDEDEQNCDKVHCHVELIIVRNHAEDGPLDHLLMNWFPGAMFGSCYVVSMEWAS